MRLLRLAGIGNYCVIAEGLIRQILKSRVGREREHFPSIKHLVHIISG